MKRTTILTLILILSGVAAFTQDVSDLFYRAVHLQEVKGDLEAAIPLFEKVVSESKDPSLAAKAQLRIGMCFEMLGQREARAAYQKVIDGYPQQHQEVALARERIAALAKTLATMSDKPSFLKIDIPVKLPWQSPTPNGPVDAFGARLSPDGKTLAFGSEGSIWVIPVPGKVSADIAGEPRRLTEAIYAVGSGVSWPADGKQISFNAAREDGGEDIYVIPRDGGKPAKFASRPPMGLASYAYDSTLSLSPDGGVLAFASKEGEGRESLRVQTVPRGAALPKSLTNSRSAEPAFSPDGRRIAYVNLSPREIRVIPAAGGESVSIADTANRTVRSPVWSPDGQMVAFLAGTDNSADELWIVPVSEPGHGTAIPTSFKLPGKTSTPLAGWTSDDKIGLILGSPNSPTHQAIYTVPASGGKATQVTPSGSFYFPRW